MQRFAPGVIDYNGVMAANYPAGRALSAQSAETWRSAIAPFVPRKSDLTILDLGSGTGRFTSLLSVSFRARVIGVEPAHAMRSIAVSNSHPAEVAFVAGAIEGIPLRDRSCDVAWLSQVLHHFRDLASAAREIRRVLRGPAVVLIRGTFADGENGFPTLLHFFPGVRRIFKNLATVGDTIREFEAQGFALDARRRVQQQTCGSLREFAERTRLRADSSLALLSESEFETCQRALEGAAQEAPPSPILETLDLLALRSSAPSAFGA